uniref:Uncharacterized protein n=1 Tax=Romanomermis culicivorax TaxID=13658 RepID=A0A915IYD4_ROMCU
MFAFLLQQNCILFELLTSKSEKNGGNFMSWEPSRYQMESGLSLKRDFVDRIKHYSKNRDFRGVGTSGESGHSHINFFWFLKRVHSSRCRFWASSDFCLRSNHLYDFHPNVFGVKAPSALLAVIVASSFKMLKMRPIDFKK